MSRSIILATPVILLLSTFLVFRYGSRRFGDEKGYLIGFAFYWFCWCLAVPWLLMKKDFTDLLVDHLPLFSIQNWHAALLWVCVTLVTLFMYGKNFIKTPLTLILLAIPFATLNGFCEEILWRGMFTRAFPGNPLLGILYPAIGFAFWHLVPQSVYPSPNILGFIFSTFLLGLVYGFIAYSTGSAFWTALSHSMGGALALSGLIAPTILKLTGIGAGKTA